MSQSFFRLGVEGSVDGVNSRYAFFMRISKGVDMVSKRKGFGERWKRATERKRVSGSVVKRMRKGYIAGSRLGKEEQ